jgi:phosphate transport system permease protein
MRTQAERHSALTRQLHNIRMQEVRSHANPAALAAFDEFANGFSDAAEDLNGIVSDSGEQAVALRDSLLHASEQSSGLEAATAKQLAVVAAAPVPAQGLVALRSAADRFERIALTMKDRIDRLIAAPPALTEAKARALFERWKKSTREYLAGLPDTTQQLRAWDPHKPVPAYRALTSFLFGPDWVTASFWQDWYGIIPLLVGSIMVALVALLLAVPFGVSAAIYVSEVATRAEKRLIKPYIEFISAIPSVVLGFFGIAVVGQAVRALSQAPWMQWVPFFPISERLNVFTAGCLLALMAVPTIFTLAEDALRNVPRGFKEASYALGANRLQTIVRVLIPASLSGIISAILLGLGRVIGETMVVLLCAGNRIAIPDFTQGLGAVFQPVHTMTGIIAQEMGEVVRGSIHYRALFMVGLVLFALTLGINYLAQKIVGRYRLSIG